jgi:hypothetical protein
MKDDLKKIKQPKTIEIKTMVWKTTSIFFGKGRRHIYFWKMEDDLKKIMQPKSIESKNNGCGTAPGNLVFKIFSVSR